MSQKIMRHTVVGNDLIRFKSSGNRESSRAQNFYPGESDSGDEQKGTSLVSQ
jgi:hypothetical protein